MLLQKFMLFLCILLLHLRIPLLWHQQMLILLYICADCSCTGVTAVAAVDAAFVPAEAYFVVAHENIAVAPENTVVALAPAYIASAPENIAVTPANTAVTVPYIIKIIILVAPPAEVVAPTGNVFATDLYGTSTLLWLLCATDDRTGDLVTSHTYSCGIFLLLNAPGLFRIMCLILILIQFV